MSKTVNLAIQRVENAVNRVADAGRDASTAAEQRGASWWVPDEEMAELRCALAEWSSASDDFMRALAEQETEPPAMERTENPDVSFADTGESFESGGERRVQWIEDGVAYNSRALQCAACGVYAIVPLPPRALAEQKDDTTHCCLEALGGCNHGFSSLPAPIGAVR